MPPFSALFDQMGAPENAEVLGNCRPRHRECACDVTSRARSRTQQIEHGAAGWIGESAEGCIGKTSSALQT